ncbi:MAG: S53 family peptidase [Thermoplasmata archaeon]|nr:S53 family peptidase [Thermoplasmata archaeon]
MYSDGRRIRGAPPFLALALPVLLMAVYLLPGGAGGAAPSHSSPASVDTATFATRSGFAPNLLRGVSEPTLAEGTTSAVVTFSPTRPGLFDAPSTQAAPLSPTDIGARFGLSPAAYASAKQYFVSQGLSIEHAGPDRLSLTVEGSAGAMDRAFSTSLIDGNYQGRAVQFPATAPALPGPLESEVSGVAGLSTGWDQFSLPLSKTVGAGSATPSQGPADLVSPAIARQIYEASQLYNFTGTPTYSSGQGIVLLLWGDGYSPDDLTTFFSSDYPSGIFPTVVIHPAPIDGAPLPGPGAVNDPSGAPEELTLDLEWSGSLAPGATLDPVYAPDGPSSDGYSPTDVSMADALHYAVTGISGVDAISMSFGTAESTASGLESAWTTDLAEAAQEKITLLAATGDTGGDTSLKPTCTGVPQPNYPASDPGVLAVGGTDPSLARNVVGQVTGIAAESAWSGSGGGFSLSFPAPSWQEVGSARAPIEANGFRGMPDLSAAAADNFVYYDGQEQTGAGTSFATPLWAGLITEMDALHGTPLGFVTPRLYYIGSSEPYGTVADGLVDVTSGSNCLGPATVGWDTSTGWGSPRALDLYADLTSTFVNLSIDVTPAPVGPGGSLTIGARLTNASTGNPIPGVSVLVTLTADTTFGPCDGTFGTATSETNASGRMSVMIPVPACYLGSRAIASVSVMSDGLFGTNQTQVGVNLLGYLGFLGPVSTYPADIGVYALIMGAAIAIGFLLGTGPPGRPTRVRAPAPPPIRVASAPPATPPAPPPVPPPPSIGPSSASWVVRPLAPPSSPNPPPGPDAPPPSS